MYAEIVEKKYGILRARGLPYGCEISDIKRFFLDYIVIENGIYLVATKGSLSG